MKDVEKKRLIKKAQKKLVFCRGKGSWSWGFKTRTGRGNGLEGDWLMERPQLDR
jgi:hypothetical protein